MLCHLQPARVVGNAPRQPMFSPSLVSDPFHQRHVLHAGDSRLSRPASRCRYPLDILHNSTIGGLYAAERSERPSSWHPSPGADPWSILGNWPTLPCAEHSLEYPYYSIRFRVQRAMDATPTHSWLGYVPYCSAYIMRGAPSYVAKKQLGPYFIPLSRDTQLWPSSHLHHLGRVAFLVI
jgi:hypothetical protein